MLRLLPTRLTLQQERVVRKIKIFKGIETELNPLEEEVNSWLEESGVELISVTGNIAPQSNSGSGMGTFSTSDVLVIVVYEDGQK